MSIEPTIAAMDCTELERSVDAYVDGEFDVRERAEADVHLAACARCRGLVLERTAIRAAVRAKLREAMGPAAAAGRAPAELRARIEAGLARGRRPLWRRALSPIPVATLAALAAGVLVVLWWHAGQRRVDLVDAAFASHHRALPPEVYAASVGEAAIPAWFVGKLDFKPSPPRFGADGVHLVGARLSNLREYSAAYFRYALPRGTAGLFIVDDPDRRFEVAGDAVEVGPRKIRIARGRGYNMAVWRDDKIVYSLVSDLDEAALRELVRTAQAGSGR